MRSSTCWEKGDDGRVEGRGCQRSPGWFPIQEALSLAANHAGDVDRDARFPSEAVDALLPRVRWVGWCRGNLAARER